MIELDENVYNKLKHDADDNKQIVRIVRIAVISIIVLIFYFSFGLNWLNVQLDSHRADIQNQIAISKAYTNLQVRHIESDGLNNEEYFKWLEVRD